MKGSTVQSEHLGYFMAAKEGKITTLKGAKKWLNDQERVDASKLATKRWRAIKLQHDGQISACGIGGTSEDNTSCSAGKWRTGTRLMSSPACSISSQQHFWGVARVGVLCQNEKKP